LTHTKSACRHSKKQNAAPSRAIGAAFISKYKIYQRAEAKITLSCARPHTPKNN
jgi:hypothetical protein